MTENTTTNTYSAGLGAHGSGNDPLIKKRLNHIAKIEIQDTSGEYIQTGVSGFPMDTTSRLLMTQSSAWIGDGTSNKLTFFGRAVLAFGDKIIAGSLKQGLNSNKKKK